MLKWELVERVLSPDGVELALARRGNEWVVRAAGRVLMSSRVHGSEELLASYALERVPGARSLLVGGLGLGFTLRSALDRLATDASVTVAELVPALVDWNRVQVGHLAGRPLDDPRVTLRTRDVYELLSEARAAYDLILLDVDNGPSPLAHEGNQRLYGPEGTRACLRALRPRGLLALWSRARDERYESTLRRAGFELEVKAVPARAGAGAQHVLFLARK